MLITKEVEVLLASRVIKYYENLGYNIPREERLYGTSKALAVPHGTRINVKVEDLPSQSNIDVECECDGCGIILKMPYCNYTKYNHDGLIYCHSCAMTKFNSGENHYKWNYSKTDEEREIGRDYPEYKEFIQKVLARDNYTCQITNKTRQETKLVVHHLNSYMSNPQDRCDVKNGITLSEDIHKLFHSIYGYGNNTKEQFMEFTGKANLILEDYNGSIPTTRCAICVTDNEIINNIPIYAKQNNIDNNLIYKCCNKRQKVCHGKVYMWYDEYIKMSAQEIENEVNDRYKKTKSAKPIVCCNLKLLFENSADASRYLLIDYYGIGKCCSGRLKTFGTYNNERLVWKYASDINNLDDYTLISHADCENITVNNVCINDKGN